MGREWHSRRPATTTDPFSLRGGVGCARLLCNSLSADAVQPASQRGTRPGPRAQIPQASRGEPASAQPLTSVSTALRRDTQQSALWTLPRGNQSRERWRGGPFSSRAPPSWPGAVWLGFKSAGWTPALEFALAGPRWCQPGSPWRPAGPDVQGAEL